MSDHSIVAALRSLPCTDTNCDNKGTVCVGVYEHENGEVEYDLHQCQFCDYRDSAADEIERLQAENEQKSISEKEGWRYADELKQEVGRLKSECEKARNAILGEAGGNVALACLNRALLDEALEQSP